MRTRPWSPTVAWKAVGLAAAAALVAGGCYQSFLPDEEARATSGCYDDAPVVALDEIASGLEDTAACRTIEVTGTADDCADSMGRVNVVVRAEGATSVWMDATVVDVPPGALTSGILSPGAACNPCGSGVLDDLPTPGHTFTSDTGFGRSAGSELDYMFLGRNVRYSVKLCALLRTGP